MEKVQFFCPYFMPLFYWGRGVGFEEVKESITKQKGKFS
jgi:hypothetical protein